jgi:hypothetical protein
MSGKSLDQACGCSARAIYNLGFWLAKPVSLPELFSKFVSEGIGLRVQSEINGPAK